MSFSASAMAFSTTMVLAGIDNIVYSKYVTPSLTTIDMGAPEQGKIAAETIIELLSGELKEQHMIIKPQIVIRNSCAKI